MGSKRTRWLPREVGPQGTDSRVEARVRCGTQGFQVSKVPLILISITARILKMLCSRCGAGRGGEVFSAGAHAALAVPPTLYLYTKHNFAKLRTTPPLTASTNAFVQALPVPEQRAALHHVCFTEGQTAHTPRLSNVQSPGLMSLTSSQPARSKP